MTADTVARIRLGGDAYAHPDLEPLLIDIDRVTPHPDNPRNGDLDAIVESIAVNGLFNPVGIQRSTGRILVGNHRYAALMALDATQIPVIWLDVDDAEAKRIMLADNRTSDLGRYDDALLMEALAEVSAAERGLLGTGYTDDDVTALAAAVAEAEATLIGEDEDDTRAPTTGEMLEMADLTWGEPHHKVHHGEVWTLGPHTLVIARVHDEHTAWAPLLTPDTILAPYPEPYLTTSEVAHDHPLLLVQPNPYLAGHLIDKHVSTHPDDTVEKRA